MEQIVENLLSEVKKLNENLKKNSKEDLLSRKDIIEQYNITPKGADKIFHLKNAPINRICKPQTIARSSLEELLRKGIN